MIRHVVGRRNVMLTRSMSASCCMRSARVKGAWMSTGGSDCSIVLFCRKSAQAQAPSWAVYFSRSHRSLEATVQDGATKWV